MKLDLKVIESTIREYALLVVETNDDNPVHYNNLKYLNDLLFEIELQKSSTNKRLRQWQKKNIDN